jgi:hypothetical protein
MNPRVSAAVTAPVLRKDNIDEATERSCVACLLKIRRAVMVVLQTLVRDGVSAPCPELSGLFRTVALDSSTNLRDDDGLTICQLCDGMVGPSRAVRRTAHALLLPDPATLGVEREPVAPRRSNDLVSFMPSRCR